MPQQKTRAKKKGKTQEHQYGKCCHCPSARESNKSHIRGERKTLIALHNWMLRAQTRPFQFSLSPLAAFSSLLLPGTNQRVSQAGRNNVADKKEADHISVCQ